MYPYYGDTIESSGKDNEFGSSLTTDLASSPSALLVLLKSPTNRKQADAIQLTTTAGADASWLLAYAPFRNCTLGGLASVHTYERQEPILAHLPPEATGQVRKVDRNERRAEKRRSGRTHTRCFQGAVPCAWFCCAVMMNRSSGGVGVDLEGRGEESSDSPELG